MSGIKKLVHKVKEKMELGEGHHGHRHDGQASKGAWPGVDETGAGGAGGAPGVITVDQTAVPSAGQPASFPGGDAHKSADASRLADYPPTYQDNKMAQGTPLSSGVTPKVLTGEHHPDTDALGKSPVYSPLGSSAHENVASAKPDVTDVGVAAPSTNISPSGHKAGNDQQPFSGTLPHVGEAPKDPKLTTTDSNPVSSKTASGTPNPLTHAKDVDHPPKMTAPGPLPSAANSGSGPDSKPRSHVDELKVAKAKAGSAVNRSPNLTGDVDTLGAPSQTKTIHTDEPKTTGPMPGSTLSGKPESRVDELKEAKAKAGNAVNRSPNLTGDINELGKPAQEAEGKPMPLVEDVSPPYNPSSKDTVPKGNDKNYTSALDKIADDGEAGTAAGAGAGGGMLAAAADYVHSGARSVADTAHQYTGAGDDNKSLTDQAKDTTQAAADKVMPDQGTTSTRSQPSAGTTSGKRVTTPPDDRSYVQQAKDGIAAAAAVTAEKASQAYQVVADKAYETGIPQKLGEQASTVHDAATAKYDELTNQAQKKQAAVRDVAGDRLATAKAQAQDYAQSAQQRAAEHLDRIRNASPEDINRSSLGRMVGGILLLWLASYAIGIPFKYGLAGALLAVSAVLFAEWDQGNRARRARMRSGTGTGAGKTDTAAGPESIPKFGTQGGIDAKTGAPPASIHESSIADISSGTKQNFPQDPISTNIGSGTASHGPHGAVSYGGSGLGSDSGAGPTVSPGGLGQSAGAKAPIESSFYHSIDPSRAPPADKVAAVQTERGTATGAGFNSTYHTTQPAHKVEQLQPTSAEKSRYATEE